MSRKTPLGLSPARTSCSLLASACLLSLASIRGPLRAQDEDAQLRPRTPRKAAEPQKESKEGGAAADPVEAEILKVNYVFNRELYDLAIPRYEKLLADNPTYARLDRVHYPLGLAHYNLAAKLAKREGAADQPRIDRLKKAITHLKEAVKRKEFESRPEATRILGHALLLLDDFDGASRAFQWVVEKGGSPKEAAPAALGLGEAAYLKGDFPKAAQAYRAAIDRGPEGEDLDRARFYLGMALYRQGGSALAESTKHFEEAASTKNGRFADDAAYMLAVAYEARGDEEGAIAAFRKLAAPGSRQREAALHGLGGALFRAGRWKEAAAELRSFLDAYPKSEKHDAAGVLLARALLETKDSAQAAKLLGELRSSPTAGDEASLWLARVFSRSGKPRGAVTVLTAALKSFPESPIREDLQLELASARLADGDFEAAGADLERIERSASKDAGDQIAYLKAYALHRAHKLDQALAACASFRRAYPESRYTKDVAQLEAETQYLAGDYAKAREAYAAYLESFGPALDPASRLKASYRAAQALYYAKDFEEARKAFDAIDPKALGPEPEKSFAEDPLFASRAYLVGDASYQLKDHARAEKDLRSFLAAAGSGPQPPDPIVSEQLNDARFKLAHVLELDGRLDAAREAFEKALAADAKSPHREQILFELGQIAYTGKDTAEAGKRFSQVLAEFPESRFAPHALRFLGWIAFEAKDYAGAAGRYAKLVEAFPDHALAKDAEFQLALCLKSQGKPEEARAAFAKFKQRHPEDPRVGRVVFEEAVALARADKPREALAALEKLRASGPPADLLPPILYETAWCHRALSSLDEAEKVYAELAATPDAGPLAATARLELGELRFERKDYAKAVEVLTPLAAADAPEREKALYRLAWSHHMLDDGPATARAYEAFAKAFPKSPLVPEVALLAAKAYLKDGDTAKAAKIFRGVVERGGNDGQLEIALVSLGECLAQDHEFGEASKRFEELLARYPKSPLAYRARFGSGWSAENLGKLDDALAKYRAVAAETKTATGARAQFQIGQCLAAKKQYKDAIVEFLQVPGNFPYAEWSAKALLQVGGCFEALEDPENARKYYEEVAASYPDRDEAKLAKERMAKL